MELDQRLLGVIARCRAFYAAREPGHILVGVSVPVDTPPLPPLYAFDLDRQLGQWLDCKLGAARAGWRAKAGLDDDTVPTICPQFGIAEHSAWLGMQVRAQETTNLPVPLVVDPGDLDRMRLNPETPWYHYMRDGYRHLRGRQDGSFVLAVRGTMAPMDLANALRGDEVFADFILDPAFAHRLMTFCTQAIAWYYPQLVSWADSYDGGHFFLYHGSWMGPHALGHLSNDTAMLCGRAIYDEFGFPYERELAASYGPVLYHVHNQKLHYVPKLATLPNLALLEVTNDPKTPLALDDLARVLPCTAPANLYLHATSDQVRAHLFELKDRNVFLDVTCRDRADAADILAFVRSVSRPLAAGA